MSLFQKFRGVRDDLIQIGGHLGLIIKRFTSGGGSDHFRILKFDEDTYTNIQHADAPVADNGTTSMHSATIGDVTDRNPLVAMSFDGDAAPTASDHTGKYAYCHTSGTTSGKSYVAKQVYKAEQTDRKISGASDVSWKEIDLEENSQFLTTMAGFVETGDSPLKADSYYGYEAGNWVYKGGASVASDGWKTIKIAFTTASASSSTSIPTNAIIKRTQWNIKTEYSAIAGALDINGQAIGALLSGERYVNQYIDDSEYTVTSGGIVDLTLTGAAAGTGEVTISYVVPQT